MRPSESQILTYHDLITSNPLATTAPTSPGSYRTFAEYRQAVDLSIWFNGQGYHVQVTSGSTSGADVGSRQVQVNGVVFVVFERQLISLGALAVLYGRGDATALAQAKAEGKLPRYESIEIEVQQHGLVPGSATVTFVWSDGTRHDEPEPGTYQPLLGGGYYNQEPPPSAGAYQEHGPATMKKAEPVPDTATQTSTPPQTEPTRNDGAAGGTREAEMSDEPPSTVMIWILLFIGFAVWRMTR